MIVTDTVIIKDIEYKRARSDSGYYIERNGAKYEEAIDDINSSYTYTELEEQINGGEATEADYIRALKLLGVNI